MLRTFSLSPAARPIQTEIVLFDLSDANAALDQLRTGRLTGAAVLVPDAAIAAS